MSVNKAILVGRLGADPELRNTQSGTSVANMRIATEDYNGDTQWHRVACFGGLAENVDKYLEKGRQVYVEGEIRYSEWEDRDGNDHETAEVVANDVTFLSSSGGGSGEAAPDEKVGSSDYSDESFSEDDVPF